MTAMPGPARRIPAQSFEGDTLMSAESDGPKLPREPRFQRIIDDAGTDMQARQAKVLLLTEVKGILRDIEYLKDQFEVLLAQRDKLQADISAIEPENATLKQHVERLQAEKILVSGREGLEALERTLTEMVESVPRLQIELPRLENEVRDLPARMGAREAQLATLRGKSQELETEAEAFRSLLQALEDEIAVITSTRDIITGVIPADLDTATVGAIQDNLEDTFNQYLHDAQDDIKSISAQNEVLKAELQAMHEEKYALSTRRETLFRAAKSFPAEGDDNESPEELAEEVAQLNDFTVSSVLQREAALEALQAARFEEGELDALLAQASERFEAGKKKRDALAALKETVGDVADIDVEIERLKALAHAHTAAARADHGMLREGMVVARHLENLNERLSEACEKLRPVSNKAGRLAGFTKNS